jgi:tungstate transport system ATP-binding protein
MNASMADASILPLRVEGVRFEAGGGVIIDGVSFEVAARRRLVVLGPNGAGKSVLLRLCHGLLEPSAGAIRWTAPLHEVRARQAMVFQRPVMLRRSALANLAYPLAKRGVARAARLARARDVLGRVGLQALADRQARALSVGEQQRLALARAWTLDPQVLFLDEPTASLDPSATRTVEDIVLAMHRAGTTIVMTTHDLGQARRMAEEVVFLHRGRLVERAPAEAFFAAPRSHEAAAFVRGELPW